MLYSIVYIDWYKRGHFITVPLDLDSQDAMTIRDDIYDYIQQVDPDSYYLGFKLKFNFIPNPTNIDLLDSPLVYVISDGDNIKIGKSCKFISRLFSMQSNNAKALQVLKIIKCDSDNSAKLLEKKLHLRFKKYRVSGEWYSKEILNDIR